MKKVIYLSLLLLLTTSTLMAHQPTDPAPTPALTHTEVTKMISIHGVVKADGEADGLVGATIEYDGKRYYTDLEGKFTITSNANRPTNTLIVSQISYTPKTIVIDSQSSVSLLVELNQ